MFRGLWFRVDVSGFRLINYKFFFVKINQKVINVFIFY